MLCDNCGKEIMEDMKFCSNCGKSLMGNGAVFTPTNQSSSHIVSPQQSNINCPYCRQQLSYAPEQIGVDMRQLPIYHTFGYCVKCKVKWDMDNVSQQSFVHQQNLPTQQITQYNAPVNAICCPRCKSRNIQYVSRDIIGRRTKGKTSLNLNPLKPFTVFNHKEKVTRRGFEVNQWCCLDCGKNFTKNVR